MNGYDTELDKIASWNLQSSLYSLSHFNTLKVMSHLAILRADVALLDYVRHWRSYISGRQSPVLALFLLLTLLLFTFELRHKEPLQRRPRNNERDSKLLPALVKYIRKNLDVTKLYGVHILPVPFEVPLDIYSFSSKRDLMRTNSNTENRIVKNFF